MSKPLKDQFRRTYQILEPERKLASPFSCFDGMQSACADTISWGKGNSESTCKLISSAFTTNGRNNSKFSSTPNKKAFKKWVELPWFLNSHNLPFKLKSLSCLPDQLDIFESFTRMVCLKCLTAVCRADLLRLNNKPEITPLNSPAAHSCNRNSL